MHEQRWVEGLQIRENDGRKGGRGRRETYARCYHYVLTFLELLRRSPYLFSFPVHLIPDHSVSLLALVLNPALPAHPASLYRSFLSHALCLSLSVSVSL